MRAGLLYEEGWLHGVVWAVSYARSRSAHGAEEYGEVMSMWEIIGTIIGIILFVVLGLLCWAVWASAEILDYLDDGDE